jgi:hypothetical protein
VAGNRILKGRMRTGPHLRLQFLQHLSGNKDCTQSRNGALSCTTHRRAVSPSSSQASTISW